MARSWLPSSMVGVAMAHNVFASPRTSPRVTHRGSADAASSRAWASRPDSRCAAESRSSTCAWPYGLVSVASTVFLASSSVSIQSSVWPTVLNHRHSRTARRQARFEHRVPPGRDLLEQARRVQVVEQCPGPVRLAAKESGRGRHPEILAGEPAEQPEQALLLLAELPVGDQAGDHAGLVELAVRGARTGLVEQSQ